MKRVLLWIVAVVGGLGALLVAGILVYVLGLHPRMRKAPNLTATPDQVERGEYLANHVALCPHCHSSAEKSRGEGRPPEHLWIGDRANPDFAELKGMTIRNLTPSATYGLATWTDGEIVRAIRDGVNREGRGLFPAMPYEHFAQGLTDADALAIVAYLRSLPAKEQGPPRSKLPFGPGLYARMVVAPAPPLAPVAPDSPEHGRRLLRAALCAMCHNGDDATPERPDFAGGQEYYGVLVPNITSDPATGIGTYSVDDIIRALEGTKKNGSKIREMPTYLYKGLSKDDKVAIALAVKAIPPVVRIPGAAGHR